MRPEQKTKSRSKLYNAISGAKVITGVAGTSAVGTIEFANIPLVTETVTIGGIVFGFKVGAAEAAGTSAGTAADPHLCSVDTSLDAVGTSLAAQIPAETTTTGKWEYLYPDDSVGCVWSTDTLTLTFWPGAWANSVTLAGSATDETIVQPVTASLGRNTVANLSGDAAYNIIDSTGGTQNKEYYPLPDGHSIGESTIVVINGMESGDTPTLVGNFSENGVAMVECEFITAELGASATFMWDGSYWEMINYNPLHTVPDFTASA